MVVERGEIWWATLRPSRESEPGFRRPVLIVQSDAFNRSRIRTIMAVVVTSNLRLARAPGNVEVSEKQSQLPKRSVVNVSQIVTLDESFLKGRVGRLDEKTMRAVDAGLRLVLSLR
ncbi:MAG: type II toxin-antitoxin system PemK/MazF family toxin [Candidatus Latescibacterota bacterium]|nr:MAG: type II toxin-antitoxin system PemK/MazF family toxin [Candidatus Latescibacterota bacterium]